MYSYCTLDSINWIDFNFRREKQICFALHFNVEPQSLLDLHYANDT